MKRCLPLLLTLFALAVPATAAASTTFGAEVGTDFTSQLRGQWSQDKVVSNLQRAVQGRGPGGTR